MAMNLKTLLTMAFILMASVDSAVPFSLRQGRHLIDISPTLNLQAAYNLCNDPIHHGPLVEQQTSFSWETLSGNNRSLHRLRDQVQQAMEELEPSHTCSGSYLTEQQLSHFVSINPAAQYMNDVTMMYTELAEVAYLFRVLRSARARRCCIQLPRFHMDNRVMTKWFNMQSYLGQTISSENCMLTGHVIEQNLNRCENVRDFVYVILRHGAGKVEEAIRLLGYMTQSQR